MDSLFEEKKESCKTLTCDLATEGVWPLAVIAYIVITGIVISEVVVVRE